MLKNQKIILVYLLGLFILQGCSNLRVEDTVVQPKPVEQPKVVEEVVEEPIEVPDFNAFKDVKLKKKTFFDFIYSFVESVNLEVKRRHLRISAIAQKSATEITADEGIFIDKMALLYLKDHDSSNTIETAKILIPYVDIVPPSLALAQAANESAWGTSRFATDANNFFGQWCFKQGCGLVPEQRSSNSKFEVRKFASVEDSVRSYIRNINTHRAYTELREIREDVRENGEFPDGETLSQGLKRYSKRGEDYINELQSMIKYNNLDEYDEIWKNMLKLEGIGVSAQQESNQ